MIARDRNFINHVKPCAVILGWIIFHDLHNMCVTVPAVDVAAYASLNCTKFCNSYSCKPLSKSAGVTSQMKPPWLNFGTQ